MHQESASVSVLRAYGCCCCHAAVVQWRQSLYGVINIFKMIIIAVGIIIVNHNTTFPRCLNAHIIIRLITVIVACNINITAKLIDLTDTVESYNIKLRRAFCMFLMFSSCEGEARGADSAGIVTRCILEIPL